MICVKRDSKRHLRMLSSDCVHKVFEIGVCSVQSIAYEQ